MADFSSWKRWESKYENSAIVLMYDERDTDSNSLDEAWDMILGTINY